jgi:NTE family protein
MSPRCLIVVLCLELLAGCTTLQPAMKPRNVALTGPLRAETGPRDSGEILLFLSFSGGGTRAAALSYGVLEELRDALIASDGKTTRLLDEVDVISSVSGGSFTAAYYGLYGERIFDDYMEVFLTRNVQKDLMLRVLNPVNWIRSVTTGISRTDAAIEYYDKHIFKNATFADLYRRKGPFIEINATDLGTADRFAFTPQTFRLICTDLSRIKISEAVTASSAFPVAFAPIVLANHAGSCDAEKPEWMKEPRSDSRYFVRQQTIIENMESYLDADARPYIHLIDGGIADNLGLRAVIDRVVMRDRSRGAFGAIQGPLPKAVAFIVVNAETEPANPFEQSPKKPTLAEIVTALGDAHIRQMNLETRALIQEDLEHWTSELAQSELGTHYIEVSFEGIEAPGTRAVFNSIVTTLALPENEVEMLREAGRTLLRESAPFQELLADLRREAAPEAGGGDRS